MLDEPLSALDVGARARVRDLIREELARFEGVRIVVTHDPVEASTLADRLVLLEEGRVTQIGSPEEIRTSPRSRYAADLVGLNAFTGRLEPLEDGAAASSPRTERSWCRGWTERMAWRRSRSSDRST